ncbi:juvenile hormone esterase-like [Anthonomus grandis grandis]|uniref:juvenile hormone esterase-like n=1 Tax=Anthonomus grandis grandis TaxID=2921223 RepID=UPI00216546CC|nr:juvenile hormone esterase-like [Anthonomus grandis grandis]
MGPVVRVLQGDLEGAEGIDFEGNTFYKFLGVPYAKAPIGELRFKDPVPAESWMGVRNATEDGDACYQNDLFAHQIYGSEDCLNLNIFTPELPSNDKFNLKPVMVWIHGGGFSQGSNDSKKIYGPEFLMTENVVLVTINYRLGLLGFLRIKDPNFNISGNMGFKDQVEALRWIKSNIQQFNGDPDNVTIFGESAGGASVHNLVLSPLARGLFHKAICQSGASLCPWGDDGDHSAVQIAKIHDSSISTEKEAVHLFKNMSVQELHKIQEKVHNFNQGMRVGVLGLVIEPADRKNAFMTKRPIDIITSGDYGKVPIIFGYNNREAILFYFEKLGKGEINPEKKLSVEKFIPHNINLKKNDSATYHLLDKLSSVYFNGGDLQDNNIMLMSDAMFVMGILGSVKNHAQSSPLPVYLYQLSLETKLNTIKTLLKLEHASGCSHADDLGYLFKTLVTPESIEPGSIEDLSLRRMLRLWSNFARYGNPTPEEDEFKITWKPARARQLNTLVIDEELKMEINPGGKRLDMWKQIYQQAPATSKYL